MVEVHHWGYDKVTQKFTTVLDGSLRTDSHGEVFLRVFPGTYDMSISSVAFLPAAQRVRVTKDSTKYLKVALKFDRSLKPAGG
jgi:uncharacterized membrane protein